MSRPRSTKPSYCHDTASDRAYVRIDGQKKYLGAYNSPQSRDEYDRLIGEWITLGRPRGVAKAGITVGEIIAAFWAHAKAAYPASECAKGRAPDGELGSYWYALRPLRRLYSRTPAVDFGPRALKALREEMIRIGWCRTNINRQTSRIKFVFRWAVENELIPGELYHRLSAVQGLRRGRHEQIRESEPVKPVPESIVDLTTPYLSRQVRAMVELQLITGMRPGEICAMRTCDIDRSDRTWVYRLEHHKTAHHGITRAIRLGPKAQKLITPFLKPILQAFVFSPADAERERRERVRAARTTPLNCGNRPGTNRSRAPRRTPGDRYDVTTYRRAIARGCDRADEWAKAGRVVGEDERMIERWHPNQLRHTAATRLRREYGLEVAQVILGHKTLTTTQVYAEADVVRAEQVMSEVG